MTRNVNAIINKLSPARRKKVEARAAQLIAEEMTLQELRRARKVTQQNIARSLHIGQDGVSKIEQRSDLLISTLRKTIEAMGGNLSLVAEFPTASQSSCRASLTRITTLSPPTANALTTAHKLPLVALA